MELIKLKHTKTESDIQSHLIREHRALFNDESKSRLLEMIKSFFPEMRTAYIIFWLPEESEDIVTLLINNNTIASIEFDRYDTSIEPIVESKPIDRHYIKGLRRYPQLTIAVAVELANSDLMSHRN
ncbi:hypothetical protein [Paenibacillus sp. KS-LC4]|uniref:hypothetical protein n=1 Tax=Paenibacillus sp. KS-LC4 TaxID=2979727 RepID=UPI0030D52D95